MSNEIKLKKRNWVFRWLREKTGINSLAMEFYETQDKIEKIKEYVRDDIKSMSELRSRVVNIEIVQEKIKEYMYRENDKITRDVCELRNGISNTEIKLKELSLDNIIFCEECGVIVKKDKAKCVDYCGGEEYYCDRHAPKYDRVEIDENGTNYYKNNVEVDKNGKIKIK